MRLLGLTLCLLASSFGARAESIEDRMAALERRVKVLEEALRNKSEAPTLNRCASATLDETAQLLCIENGHADSDRLALSVSKQFTDAAVRSQ